MDTTLNSLAMKKTPEPAAEEAAAKELVRLAREMTEHLGHEKNRVPQGRESTNVRNGTRPESVLTGASGQVQVEVPRDRDGTFGPVVARETAAPAG